jgi:Acetyltransferase (GNAT) domain
MITNYSSKDRGAVAELQQLLWQAGPEGNVRYLDWKYFQNPYIDDRYLVLAWEDENLVGMVGAFGACWEIPGSKRAVLPCLSDTVIVPARRGGPLFREMLDTLIGRQAADAVPWLLDFGDQPAGPAMVMRGWRSVGPWGVAKAALGRTEDEWDERTWTYGSTRIGPRSGATLHCTATIDAIAVAKLVAKVEPTDKVRHVRDATYLDWRFRNPLARHYFLSVTQGEMIGYLLAHRTLVDGLWGATPTTIMDCEAESDDIWADLIGAAMQLLPGRELVMWIRDISPSRISLLLRLGLRLVQPSGRLTADVDLPNLLICPTGATADSALADLNDPSCWDLRSICGRSWR